MHSFKRSVIIWDNRNWPKAGMIPGHNLQCFLSVVTKPVKLKFINIVASDWAFARK